MDGGFYSPRWIENCRIQSTMGTMNDFSFSHPKIRGMKFNVLIAALTGALHIIFGHKSFLRGRKEKGANPTHPERVTRSAFAKNEPNRAQLGANPVCLGRENSQFSFSRTATLNCNSGHIKLSKFVVVN